MKLRGLQQYTIRTAAHKQFPIETPGRTIVSARSQVPVYVPRPEHDIVAHSREKSPSRGTITFNAPGTEVKRAGVEPTG